MNLLNDWISESMLSAFGWTLIHSVWQMILISAILWIGLKIFRSKSPDFKYRMSYAAMLLCLITTVGTFVYVFDSSEYSVIPASGEIALAMNQAINSQTIVDSRISTWDSLVKVLDPQIPFLVNVWFLGALLFLFRLFGNLAAVRNLKVASQPVKDFELEKTFYRLIGKMDLGNNVELRTGEHSSSPLTFGTFKPVVLIPAGLIFHLSPSQLEAIIAHELAHIKRYDYLANVIQSSLEVIFFYHPSFWWMSQTIKELRENAADDLAVEAGISPDTLAYSLAEVLNYSRGAQSELALAAAKKRNPTLQRIKRILGQPAQTYPQNPIISIPMILTLFITLGMVATTAQPLPEKPEEVMPLASVQMPEVEIPFQLASLPDTTEKKVLKEVIIHTDEETSDKNVTRIYIDDDKEEGENVFVWEDSEGVVLELKGTDKVMLQYDKDMLILDGDTLELGGLENLYIDSMVFDMSNFPVLELADMPNISMMPSVDFDFEEFAPLPDMDFDFEFDAPMMFEFEGGEDYVFWEVDTTEMSKEEREAWQKDWERKAEEFAKKMEEKAKVWEEEMGPKFKEYEERMKEWQKTWEPKMKEYEEKIKAWQKENEPKMREFEMKMQQWEKENQPKIEEFQKKVEKWQKENEVKIQELVKQLEKETSEVNKENLEAQYEAALKAMELEMKANRENIETAKELEMMARELELQQRKAVIEARKAEIEAQKNANENN